MEDKKILDTPEIERSIIKNDYSGFPLCHLSGKFLFRVDIIDYSAVDSTENERSYSGAK